MDTEPPDPLPPLGARICARRKELGLTQAELATRTGRSQALISLWENGRAPINALWLPVIARALGLPTAAALDPEAQVENGEVTSPDPSRPPAGIAMGHAWHGVLRGARTLLARIEAFEREAGRARLAEILAPAGDPTRWTGPDGIVYDLTRPLIDRHDDAWWCHAWLVPLPGSAYEFPVPYMHRDLGAFREPLDEVIRNWGPLTPGRIHDPAPPGPDSDAVEPATVSAAATGTTVAAMAPAGAV